MQLYVIRDYDIYLHHKHMQRIVKNKVAHHQN